MRPLKFLLFLAYAVGSLIDGTFDGNPCRSPGCDGIVPRVGKGRKCNQAAHHA